MLFVQFRMTPTGRACWSLGNAHAAMGNHEKALHYAQRHLEISREVSQTRTNQPYRIEVQLKLLMIIDFLSLLLLFI